MARDAIIHIYDEVLADRRLLSHRFYRRWEAGELSGWELAAYAAQYRHFEAALPDLLETVSQALPSGPARLAVEANLADERAVPAAHLSLFDAFAEAVGAEPEPPSPATTVLVDSYQAAGQAGPVAALAAIGAYEVQSSAIAITKSEGLRSHYGLSPADTRFWDVHGTMDEDHATWLVDALSALEASGDVVRSSAREAADVWWAFLDERQALAGVGACR